MPIKKTLPKAAATKKDALKKLTVPALRAKAKRAGIRLSKTDGSQKTKAQLVLALDKVPAPKKKATTRRKLVDPYKPLITGPTDKFKDIKREALKPGKRVSKTGRVYYERRANRSDVSQFLGFDGEQEKFMFTVGVAYAKFLDSLQEYKKETSRDITEKLLDIPEMFRTAEILRADIAAAIKVLKRYDAGLDNDDYDPYEDD